MSTFFNYERAWREYVSPEFDKLCPVIELAYKALQTKVHDLYQVGASKELTGVTPEITVAFDALDTEVLIKAHEIVYYYGHLSPIKSAQDGGLYWKFQDLCWASIFKRGTAATKSATCGGALEDLRRFTLGVEAKLKEFHDHKEGTEYDDEELPAHLISLMPELKDKILKADHVNHKPDIFCIGSAHMRLSTGMYLDPNVAPCCNCGQPYSAHTSERVLYVRPGTEDNEIIKVLLLSIKDLCEKNKVKVDGFALIK